MGSFVFKWDHPAEEVYVTGTFDSWSKSEKLVKTGSSFEKNVTLSSANEKIFYKFVVDGNWVTDHTAPQENDASGNLNNVLTTERIIKHTPETAGIMSGVAPTSTTAGLAKDVPLEKQTSNSSALPGAFPETPAAVERGEYSVNPLPAADGAVNPIKLAPGEKVPDSSTYTNNTINSGVHDDPELVAADLKKQKADGEKFLERVKANTVYCEIRTDNGSPVPRFNRLDRTTAQLAGGVPLESSKVPDVVKASQKDAGASPEASAVPEEVKEKSAVEKELESKVPVAATTSEGTAGQGTTKSETSTSGGIFAAVGGAAVALGGAAAAAASGTASRLPESITSKLPESVQNSVGTANTPSNSKATADDTPQVVKESIAQSSQGAEAAGNKEAVLDKKAVEKELLSEVKPETSTGESAPKITTEVPSGSLNAPMISRPVESRDVSPGTVPGSHTQGQTVPTVTSGVGSATTAEKSTAVAPSTPAKNVSGNGKAADSPAGNSTADKKKKRTSFFGKLKAKLSDKNKS